MSVILSRNTTLFVSTVESGFTTANTTKLSILDGYKLTQASVLNTYSTFRNALAPSRLDTKYVKDVELVNLDFRTYVKTKDNAGLKESSDLHLWNALTNNGTAKFSDRFEIDFVSSKTNTFPDLFIYVNMEGDVFKVGKCYIESVNIEFDIDGIVTTSWKIKALAFTNVATAPATFLDRTERVGYLKGRLSILEFNRQAQEYNLPILGGSITISNSIVKLSTPIVSQQLATNLRAKVEGRSVDGSISVYLRTGKNRSVELLNSMLVAMSTINDLASITINLGGGTGRRLAIILPRTIVGLPQLNLKDVVTTDISLSPVESAIGANDDIQLIYYN